MSLRFLFALVAFLVAGTVAAAGLVKTDTVVGKGKEAVAGKIVVVNYTGWLHDASAKGNKGKQFDGSIGRGPFDFPLGAGGVIPPNATLVFDVELLDVK